MKVEVDRERQANPRYPGQKDPAELADIYHLACSIHPQTH